MSRGYPRFLFCDPANIKDMGPYIIHTIEPQFIVKPRFDERRNIIHWKVLGVWSYGFGELAIDKIAHEIPEWFRRSGIQQSSNEDDVLISAIQKMSFLGNVSEAITVEEAKQMINVMFPTKTKTIYEGTSSYGIKHFFEHVSAFVVGERFKNKYCSNDTVIQAFEELGYKWKQHGPNRDFNISAREINKAKRLFWNY